MNINVKEFDEGIHEGTDAGSTTESLRDWKTKLSSQKALFRIVFWGSLILAFLIYVGQAMLSVSQTGEMPQSWRGGVPLTLIAFLTCCGLYKLVIVLVVKYGWEGVILKWSILVNGLFIASTLTFHLLPWVAYWHRAPVIASLLHISVYGLVLGYFLVADAPMNYLMEKKRHYYFCTTAMIIAGITGVVWIKAGYRAPALPAVLPAITEQAPPPVHHKHKNRAPHHLTAPNTTFDESLPQVHLRLAAQEPDFSSSRTREAAPHDYRGDWGAVGFLFICVVVIIHVISSSARKRKYYKALRDAHDFTAPNIHGSDRGASRDDADSGGWL